LSGSIGWNNPIIGGVIQKNLAFNCEFGNNYSIVIEKRVKNMKKVMPEIKVDAKGDYFAVVGGKTIKSYSKSYVQKRVSAMIASLEDYTMEEDKKAERFDINQRFTFVEKLVNMVASGVQPSAVITGQGGLGKTFTVTKTLQNNGYEDISSLADFQVGAVLNMRKCFTTVKGYSTAKGLYRTLFENNKSVIVFDDCDAVLKDPVALNLLKGALDSYGKRVISWNADMRDEDLPRSFEFTGRVIFISNMEQGKIDQAIRSRSMMIDLSMNVDQKLERMEFIAKSDEFLPEYESDVKTDALELIRDIKDEVKEISLRTLIAVSKIRASNKDWKDLATYMLTA